MMYDVNRGWKFTNSENETMMVNLPYDAMIHETRARGNSNGSRSGYFPGGCYTYEKKIDIPEHAADADIIFRFGACYGFTDVYVNNDMRFTHKYGFTPFDVDISGDCIGGSVTLRLEVDNSYTPNCRWYSGSGIIHPVCMFVGDKRLLGTKIRTYSINPPTVEISCDAENTKVTICEKSGSVLYEGNTGRISLPDAKVWSADHPVLYKAVVTNGKSSAEYIFGIRELSWNHNGFFVNGKSVKLRGCCLHHDNGVLGANSLYDAEYRKVLCLKSGGYNAIRCSHNPCSEELLKACDELGMYVLDELYDGWYIPKNYHDDSRHFEETWKDDVKSMVQKDMNHPSVIMYSIGNEVTEISTDKGIKTGEMLTDAIRAFDDSRPITCGINIMLAKWNVGLKDKVPYKRVHRSEDTEDSRESGSAFFNAMMQRLGSAMGVMVRGNKSYGVLQKMGKYLDIIGLNYGELRYDEDNAKHPEKLFLGTETLFGRQWYNVPRVEKYNNLIGDFVWTGFDYIGETDIGQWYYENKKELPLLYGAAAFDITGKPDAQLYYQRSIWGKNEKPYLGVRPLDVSNVKCVRRNWRMTDVVDSWTWHGYEGQKTEAEVYTCAPFVKLVLNGKTVSTRKTKNNIARFTLKYEPGTLEAIALDGQRKEISNSSLATGGKANKIKLTSSKMQLEPNGQDLCYIDIDIVDEAGRIVPCEDIPLMVELKNAEEIPDSPALRDTSEASEYVYASLAGFGSANPITDEIFTEGSHHTYYGHAQAVIRAGYVTESVTIHINGGQMSSSLSINICTKKSVKKSR